MSTIDSSSETLPVGTGHYFFNDFLKYFECYLSDVVDSLDDSISKLAKLVVLSGGKRIRPILVYSCGASNPNVTNDLLKAATIIELVHVATLVHDDILDDSTIRRGSPTLHSIYSKNTSILLGDALFSFALELSTDFPDNIVCKLVSNATRNTCTGEIEQSLCIKNFETTVNKYFSIIKNKTGALFNASCVIGAHIGGTSSEVIDLVGAFGSSLGINYQIYDDLIDAFGQESSFDKTLGTDFSSGKVTLPIIRLLESVSNIENEVIRTGLNSGRKDGEFLQYICELFDNYNIHERCFSELKSRISDSKMILSNIPDKKISTKLTSFMNSFDYKVVNLSRNLYPNFLD
jgi:octaprenyl-diphosphate synthase